MLMKISQYQKTYFVPGSAPVARTFKRRIDNGEIRGQVIGGIYFIEVDDEDEHESAVDKLVSKVLRNESKA
jgi:hypothetical protein